MRLIGKEKLLSPKNDYVFKRIFGFVGNEEITKGLLNSIIEGSKIKKVKLDCKQILERDLKKDKSGVLDIRAVLDNSIECDIEMQIADRKDIENRLLFYWSRLYSKSLSVGKKYISAKKTIVILFANYEISGLEEIHKYFSKWHICEDEYKNVVLTKNLEIYIIELPKFEKYNNNDELSAWVKFIIKPEEIDMNDVKENKSLKEAKKLLVKISGNKKEQKLAFQRLLHIMDQKAIEAAGFDKGKKSGLEEGEKIRHRKR